MKKLISLFAIIILCLANVNALVITNVRSSVTHDTATINYTTDVNANSLVTLKKGTDVVGTKTDGSKTQHSIFFQGLNPETAYNYNIDVSTASDNALYDGVLNTNVAPDITAPVQVQGLTEGEIGLNSIELMWDINPETDVLRYLVYRYGVNIANISSGATLKYVDTNVSPQTTYSYTISATDVSGNEGSQSNSISIRTLTPDTKAPIISEVDILELNNDRATIIWTTDEISSSVVYYRGCGTVPGSQTGTGDLNHTVILTSLVKSTLCRYTVSSCDTDNNCMNSTENSFIVGKDVEKPIISSSIIDGMFVNKGLIDISGDLKNSFSQTPDAFSSVSVYVGNSLRKTISDTGVNASFDLNNVRLDTSKTENIIKLSATDPAGNINYIEYTIYLDATPPTLEVSDISEMISEGVVAINGSVDEQSRVEIYVLQKGAIDEDSPNAITDLINTSVSDTRVSLSWKASTSTDTMQYDIYRNNRFIASTRGTTWTDNSTGGGISYEYGISSIDTSCNEGVKTSITVTTSSGEPEPSAVSNEPECNPIVVSITPQKVLDTDGDFSSDVTFGAVGGNYNIIINATDRAGNSVAVTKEVIFDNTPPEILNTNLLQLSPSYTQDVTVTGKVSENATVIVFVNGKTSSVGTWSTSVVEIVKRIGDYATGNKDYKTKTNEDGSFSVPIVLTKELEITEQDVGGVDQATVSMGLGWQNNVSILVIDESGLTASAHSSINYALCGFGNDWKVSITNINPSDLTPRFMIEGLEQISFGYNLSWQGFGQPPQVNGVRVGHGALSIEQQKNYDNGWVTINVRESDDRMRGQVVANIKKVDPTPNGENWSMFDKEKNISKHRYGSCPLIPGTDLDPTASGCVRLWLEMQIDYGDGQPQIECIDDVQILIQDRIDLSNINGFLKGSVEVIDGMIDGIDWIRDKVEPALLITTYTCLGSWVGWVIDKAFEIYKCWGLGDIYEKCEMKNGEYKGQGDEDLKSKCEACYAAKKFSKKYEHYAVHYTCDRVMSIPVPSFYTYVQQNRGNLNSYCHNYDTNLMPKTDIYKTTYKKVEEEEFKKNLVKTKNLEDDNYMYKSSNHLWCEEEYRYNWQSACLLFNPYKNSLCYQGNNDACDPVNNVLSAYDDLKVCKAEVEGKESTVMIALDGERFLIRFEGNNVTEVYNSSSFVEVTSLNEKNFNSKILTEGTQQFEIFSNSEPVYKIKDVNYPLENVKPDKLRKYISDLNSRNDVISQKEYVVDPTSGIIRGTQCVSLSSVYGYLTQYRSILQALQACFNQIIYTGSGSAGVCEATISQYTCDLIYHAIRCVKEYTSSKSKSGGFAGTELSGFFASLTGATKGIENDIYQRYGNTNMFQVMFTEKKLIHAACIGAFTGNWDLDMANLIKSTALSTPVESTVVISPANRKYRSYETIHGTTTYLYRIGVLIVAGADIDYRIDLICSEEADACADDSDFKGGKCDCNYLGTDEVYPITNKFQSASGRLNQNDKFDDEAIFVVTDHNVRYNKVRVTYKYKDQAGNVKTKIREEDLVPLGGPAPFECNFDAARRGFLCMFDSHNTGSAAFSGQPRLPNNKEYFEKGEYFNLIVPILNTLPQIPQTQQRCIQTNNIFCESSKWLQIEVLNEEGRPLALEDGKSAGAYYWTIPNTDGLHNLNYPSFEIKESHFGKVEEAQLYVEVLRGSFEISEKKITEDALEDVTDVQIEFQENNKFVLLNPTGQRIEGDTSHNYDPSTGELEEFRGIKIKIRNAQPNEGDKIRVRFTAPTRTRTQITSEAVEWTVKLGINKAQKSGDRYKRSQTTIADKTFKVKVYQNPAQESQEIKAVKCDNFDTPTIETCCVSENTIIPLIQPCVCGDTWDEEKYCDSREWCYNSSCHSDAKVCPENAIVNEKCLCKKDDSTKEMCDPADANKNLCKDGVCSKGDAMPPSIQKVEL